jgi:hypothetical protein
LVCSPCVRAALPKGGKELNQILVYLKSEEGGTDNVANINNMYLRQLHRVGFILMSNGNITVHKTGHFLEEPYTPSLKFTKDAEILINIYVLESARRIYICGTRAVQCDDD